MQTFSQKLSLLLLIAVPLNVLAGSLYRWTDEEGNVHYTDRIPPQYVEQGYRVISEQGLTIKTIASKKDEPKPDPDEALKKELEAKIKEDKSLLSTYSDESEILLIRDRKLQDIKAVITLRQESIRKLEKSFIEYTRTASDYEKKNKAIPEELQQDIKATEEQISAYQNIVEEEKQKLIDTQAHFAELVERYRNILQLMQQLDEVNAKTEN